MLLLGAGASASGGELERIHGELRRALLDLSEHVEGKWQAELPAPAAAPSSPGCARVLVVAFTGGLVPKVHPRSGVAMLTHRINGMGDDGVAALLYGRGDWRRAAAEVLKLAGSSAGSPDRLRQPLIVACGHSLGANAMGKFARLLDQSGIEVSLAVYIDAFSPEKSEVPANVACAVNFYQRAGLLKGIPVRGQSGLVAAAPARTTLLGSYLLKPPGKRPQGAPRPYRLPLYKPHHLLAYDTRVQGYVCDSVRILLQLSADGAGDGARRGAEIGAR
jgi:hypothetical protein